MFCNSRGGSSAGGLLDVGAAKSRGLGKKLRWLFLIDIFVLMPITAFSTDDFVAGEFLKKAINLSAFWGTLAKAEDRVIYVTWVNSRNADRPPRAARGSTGLALATASSAAPIERAENFIFAVNE